MLLYSPPMLENRMKKKMDSKMETGEIQESKELNVSYYIGEALLFIIYTQLFW